MENVVTPETARKLKDNGFKQPKFEAGQLWYKERYPGGTAAKWVLCVFSELDFIPLDGGNFPTGEAVFAPTATDILLELGEDWTMIVAGGGFQLYKHFQDPQYIFPISANDNPAEAAALAWLEKYAK